MEAQKANGVDHMDHQKEQYDENLQNRHASHRSKEKRWSVYLGLIGVVFGYIAAQEIAGLPAYVLQDLNAKLGPKPYYFWSNLTNNLCSIAGFALTGALGDQYGRRQFLLAGNVIALVGAIACAMSNELWTLVFAMGVAGVGNGAQQAAIFIIAENFANKHRALVTGLLFNAPFPFVATGSIVAVALTKNVTWRWMFYINIILTFFSLTLTTLFYHPPRLVKATRTWSDSDWWTVIKKQDYFGALLFNAFFALLGLAFGWGGFGVYSWGSTHVLTPLILAWVCFAGLWAWEAFAAPKFCQPLWPVIMFNKRFIFIFFTATMASFAQGGWQLWGQEVSTFYVTDGNEFKTARYQFPIGFGDQIGALAGAFLMKRIGRTNFQLSGLIFLLTVFVGLSPLLTPAYGDRKMGLAFTSIGSFCGGWVKVLEYVMVMFVVEDHYIGTACGLLNMSRGIGGAFAICFYLTIFRSRVKATIGNRVGKPIVMAGLPPTSAPLLLGALLQQPPNPAAIMEIPGITPEIIGVATTSLKLTMAAAYRIAFYVAMSGGVIGVLHAIFTANVTRDFDDHLAVNLKAEDPQALTLTRTLDRSRTADQAHLRHEDYR